MPTQSIDLASAVVATFNGSPLDQINLNGVSIWTAPVSAIDSSNASSLSFDRLIEDPHPEWNTSGSYGFNGVMGHLGNIDANNDYIVAGNTGADINGTSSGVVHVFDYSGVNVLTLFRPPEGVSTLGDGRTFGQFGQYVEIDDNNNIYVAYYHILDGRNGAQVASYQCRMAKYNIAGVELENKLIYEVTWVNATSQITPRSDGFNSSDNIHFWGSNGSGKFITSSPNPATGSSSLIYRFDWNTGAVLSEDRGGWHQHCFYSSVSDKFHAITTTPINASEHIIYNGDFSFNSAHSLDSITTTGGDLFYEHNPIGHVSYTGTGRFMTRDYSSTQMSKIYNMNTIPLTTTAMSSNMSAHGITIGAGVEFEDILVCDYHMQASNFGEANSGIKIFNSTTLQHIKTLQHDFPTLGGLTPNEGEYAMRMPCVMVNGKLITGIKRNNGSADSGGIIIWKL